MIKLEVLASLCLCDYASCILAIKCAKLYLRTNKREILAGIPVVMVI